MGLALLDLVNQLQKVDLVVYAQSGLLLLHGPGLHKLLHHALAVLDQESLGGLRRGGASHLAAGPIRAL